MRIGILTFHKAINYGAYLQAFSLSNKLHENFPNADIEIIDYSHPSGEYRKAYLVLRNIRHYGIKGGLTELKRISAFKSAQHHLPRSPRSFCTKNPEKLYAYINERYDALIIGSDAVFNWNQTGFPTVFIPNYPFSIPVYTYAASVHGLEFFSVEKDKLQHCSAAFDRMKYIGVRDACSEKFVKFCSPDAKTIHCCDPTLFLDTNAVYEKGRRVADRLEEHYGFSLDSKYIVVMAPDSRMVDAIAKKYGKNYRIVSVFVKSTYADTFAYDLDPFEWAVVLRHASLVVTSYFHGTLLSLVQGNPAIVLDYSHYCNSQYESKLKDLMLTRLHLPELYFSEQDAAQFCEDEFFFANLDQLLNRTYDKRIADAVEKEKATAEDFLKILQSAGEFSK